MFATKFNEPFYTGQLQHILGGNVCQSNCVTSGMCYLWADQSSENFGERNLSNTTRLVEDNYLKDTICIVQYWYQEIKAGFKLY